MKGEIIAKFKAWFGGNTPDIFNTRKYYVEKHEDFFYIYKKIR